MSEPGNGALRRLAILGGTGAEGRGLALRFAPAGHAVVLGSRAAAKAETTAAELNAKLAGSGIAGADNHDAAAGAEIVLLTVPWAAQLATLAAVSGALHGKILVDVTVPLAPPKVSRVHLPPQGSAVLAAQQLLGPGVRVVSAFQNVSAHQLQHLDREVACDVLVCGDDKAARAEVVALARSAGMRAWHAGPLVNSTAVEAMTSVLIFLNQTYKTPHAGIRVTGLPDGAA